MNQGHTVEPDYFAIQVLSARRFHLTLSPSLDDPVSVVSGGYEICGSSYSISRAEFPFLTFELVIKGEGELMLNGQTHPLTPGTAFIYGEGVSHKIQTHPMKGLVKYFIAVTGCEVLEWLAEAGLSMPSVFQVRNLSELEHLFDVIITTGRGDSSARVRLCNASFQHLLMRLGELCDDHIESSTNAFATYRRCRRAIEENYLQFHTVGEIALACHIAPEYLCRLFKRFRRQTPFQYLQSLKMNRAVELLREGGYSVKQVAFQMGFSDPYHFSRAFKRVYGLPPVKLLPIEKGG